MRWQPIHCRCLISVMTLVFSMNGNFLWLSYTLITWPDWLLLICHAQTLFVDNADWAVNFFCWNALFCARLCVYTRQSMLMVILLFACCWFICCLLCSLCHQHIWCHQLTHLSSSFFDTFSCGCVSLCLVTFYQRYWLDSHTLFDCIIEGGATIVTTMTIALIRGLWPLVGLFAVDKAQYWSAVHVSFVSHEIITRCDIFLVSTSLHTSCNIVLYVGARWLHCIIVQTCHLSWGECS